MVADPLPRTRQGSPEHRERQRQAAREAWARKKEQEAAEALSPTRVPDVLRDLAKRGGFQVSTKPLTKSESEDARDELIVGVQWFCDVLDTWISYSNARHVRTQIWAIDEKDAAKLVDKILATGKVSGHVAAAVRLGLAGVEWKDVIMIVGPRFLGTADFYRKNGFGF